MRGDKGLDKVGARVGLFSLGVISEKLKSKLCCGPTVRPRGEGGIDYISSSSFSFTKLQEHFKYLHSISLIKPNFNMQLYVLRVTTKEKIH